jgi:hypothetical protein
MPTRRLGAAGVMLALALAAAACTDGRAEIDAQTIALQQAASGGVVSGLRPGDPVPGAQEARVLWVTRRALGSMKHLADSVSRRYGIDVNQPPAAVGTREYYGNAARHPEVRHYFAQLALYSADMRDHAFEWVHQGIRQDLRQTRLGAAFEQGMFRGFDARMPGFKHAMDTNAGAADEMVRLHDYLVSLGDRVHYSPETQGVRFESQADLVRAQQMEQHARAAFQEAARYAARSERDARQQLQEATRLLGGS